MDRGGAGGAIGSPGGNNTATISAATISAAKINAAAAKSRLDDGLDGATQDAGTPLPRGVAVGPLARHAEARQLDQRGRTVAAEVAGRAAQGLGAKLDFSVFALAAYVVAGGGRHADLDERAGVVGRHAAADQAPPGGDGAQPLGFPLLLALMLLGQEALEIVGLLLGRQFRQSPFGAVRPRAARKSATVGRRAASLFARPLFPFSFTV